MTRTAVTSMIRTAHKTSGQAGQKRQENNSAGKPKRTNRTDITVHTIYREAGRPRQTGQEKTSEYVRQTGRT